MPLKIMNSKLVVTKLDLVKGIEVKFRSIVKTVMLSSVLFIWKVKKYKQYGTNAHTFLSLCK